MITAIYRIKSMDTMQDSLVSVLKRLSGRTRCIPGCLKAEVWTLADANEVMVQEQWRSDPELDNHMRSALYKQVLSAFELGDEMPDIQFFDCEYQMGIERIERVLLPANESKTA